MFSPLCSTSASPQHSLKAMIIMLILCMLLSYALHLPPQKQCNKCLLPSPSQCSLMMKLMIKIKWPKTPPFPMLHLSLPHEIDDQKNKMTQHSMLPHAPPLPPSLWRNWWSKINDTTLHPSQCSTPPNAPPLPIFHPSQCSTPPNAPPLPMFQMLNA